MAASEALSIDMELRRRPIRELRAVLTRLGRPTAGCVERGDFVSSLLEAACSDLAAALGRQAEQGPHEQAFLLRQLLDASAMTSAEDAAKDASQDKLLPGSVVRLFNLQSAPALNMQRASVIRYDPASDRYEVRLDWDGSMKKVRYDNLQMEENSSQVPSPTTSSTTSAPAAQPAAAATPVPAEPAACTAADVSEATVMQSAAAVAEPELGAVAASPERKRRRDGSIDRGAAEESAQAARIQATIAASPAESVAESLLDAIAAECGLGVPGPEETTSDAAPVSAASSSSAREPIILPMVEPPGRRESEAASPCRETSEPAASSATVGLAMDVEKRQEGNRPVEELACSRPPEARAEESAGPHAEADATSTSAPVILSMATGKSQESDAPSTVSSFPSGPAKKALKLRVGYGAGVGSGHAAEETGLLAEGLKQLWRAGELCDITLACRDSTLRVHRVVVASRSKALHDFLADRAEVQMPDVSYPESLQLLVEFLYEAEGEKGYVPSSSEVNMEVLELAHRFQLPGLKRRATAFMAQGLTTHNVVRHLKDCDTFGLPDLKDKIIGHLAVNKKVLAEVTEGPYIRNDPELLRQILMRVASPKDHTAPSKRARIS